LSCWQSVFTPRATSLRQADDAEYEGGSENTFKTYLAAHPLEELASVSTNTTAKSAITAVWRWMPSFPGSGGLMIDWASSIQPN